MGPTMTSETQPLSPRSLDEQEVVMQKTAGKPRGPGGGLGGVRHHSCLGCRGVRWGASGSLVGTQEGELCMVAETDL